MQLLDSFKYTFAVSRIFAKYADNQEMSKTDPEKWSSTVSLIRQIIIDCLKLLSSDLIWWESLDLFDKN